MPPLALGNHQNIVYIVNEFQAQTPTFGTLKRLDFTTDAKIEIVKIAGTSISDAQVSADGQWILFVSVTTNQDKLQLVRMDGHALQSLCCFDRWWDRAYQLLAGQQCELLDFTI